MAVRGRARRPAAHPEAGLRGGPVHNFGARLWSLVSDLAPGRRLDGVGPVTMQSLTGDAPVHDREHVRAPAPAV